MATTDETKPAGKSGRRKGKGERKKKANVGQSPAPVQLQSPEPEPVEPQIPDQNLRSQPEPAVVESPTIDHPPVAPEPVETVAPLETVAPVATVATSPESAPEPAPSPAAPKTTEVLATEVLATEVPPAEVPPAEAAPTELSTVSLQTIANAYRDYTRKSIEEFGSFVEQLSGVRSLDKAMTVQSEFVKRAYETSVAESQKICELHTRLARQTLDPFKSLTGKAPSTQGKR
jgi:hypothetical protein